MSSSSRHLPFASRRNCAGTARAFLPDNRVDKVLCYRVSRGAEQPFEFRIVDLAGQVGATAPDRIAAGQE